MVHWEKKPDDVIREINAVFRRDCFAFFDTKLSTEVTVDTSPVGLDTVLAQFAPDKPKQKKVVNCASRRLNEGERRYSQIEKEALASCGLR